MWSYELFRMKKRAGAAWSNFVHEEKGAADIIAMVVIIGIVIVLAFTFREQIFKLFNNLWNNYVVQPANNKGSLENVKDIKLDQIHLGEKTQ